MGASEGLQSLFSYSSDLILPLLVSSWECLDISASLSISWTTPYCIVLVSSCCSLSLTHFLPRALDSLLFLSWHILSIFCHFLLDVLGYVHWLCSLFLHSSLVMGSVLHSLVDLPISIFNPIFSLQKSERLIFTFIHFLKICLDHLIIFLYGARVESELGIFYYKLSIDLVIVLFFTPHSFFGLLIKIL